MKILIKNLLKLICVLFFYSAQAYVQQNKILVYAENQIFKNSIHTILEKFNIEYEDIANLNAANTNLHIIAGNIDQLHKLGLPRHYIVYQTNELAHSVTPAAMALFSRSIAVWDISQENIDKYKNSIKNYNYLPNENYEFLDPVILPCFLPLEALDTYKQLLIYSARSSDISMHIPSLFCHCVFQKPELMVEAGVRWGDGSTIPLYAARKLLNSFMVGIDINDCSKIYDHLVNCVFLNINDLNFPDYINRRDFPKNKIDFVFIDTTHDYDHTLKEIEMFVSMLSDYGTLGFHDSNSLPGDPDGVKIALKKYFNLSFDESKYGNYLVEKDHYIWNIVHYPYCNGMTIAKRIKMAE